MCSSSSSIEQPLAVNTETVQTVMEIVTSCPGGVFNVEWTGRVALPGVFNISDGTVLHITGSSASSAEDIIDGGGNQLFSVSDAELTLEGVTITGGLVEAESQTSEANGGAIFAVSSAVTLTDCVVAGNAADDDGGAVFLQGSQLEVLGTTEFANNTATSCGGAICATDNSSITIDGEAEAFFSRNAVSEYLDVGGGGAIEFYSSSNLNITGNATFRGNSAGHGGAVSWWRDCVLSITGGVEFVGNEGYNGGAIAFSGDTDDTRFDDNDVLHLGGRVHFNKNIARGDGGAFKVWGRGHMSITGEVSFTENRAGGEGGAVAVADSGTLTFRDSAVVHFTANNCTGSGGGMALWDSGGVTVYSAATIATFVGNSAGDSGGAIFATNVEDFFVYTAPGNVSFVDNNASGSGGAVRVLMAEVFVLEGVEFRGNFARIGGAVVVESSSGLASLNEGGLDLEPADIFECSFFSNIAEEDGGALHVGSGFASLKSSVFEGNMAGEGTTQKPRLKPNLGQEKN